MSRRARLDAELVRRHLAGSRQEALDLISAGRVLVNGAPAEKGSRQVDLGDNVLVSGEPPRFVSRGGEKLQAALDHFEINVDGLLALDAGASTGGFTDCLLQSGIQHVLAVDVGHGQIHPRIRSDSRVTVVERLNIRHFEYEKFFQEQAPHLTGADSGSESSNWRKTVSRNDGFDVVVADLSFISLTVVATALTAACRPEGHIVVLVKPQFEAGRREVSRGRGVITDPLVHEQACQTVADAFGAAGAAVQGLMTSPVIGGQGNKEFLLHAVLRERLQI